MIRLELKEGTSNKFWELAQSGAAYLVRWGRIGAKAQEKRYAFSTPAKATIEADKLVAEKKKKGYQEVGGKGGPKKPAAAAPAAPRNADLERLIAAAPHDTEAYLVYADWLSGAGDPRGELITLQHTLSTAMDKAERKSARGKALERRAEQILKQHDRFLPGVSPKVVTVTWRWGFFESVRFHNTEDWMDGKFEVLPVVERVLASPAAVGLTEILIGVMRWEHEEKDVPAMLKTIGEGVGAQIRRLTVGAIAGEDIDTGHYLPGKLDGISKYFPALESLLVHGADFTLGALDLPKLRELRIETCGLSRKNMKSILAGRWPALERLVIWFGSDEHGSQCGVKDLEALLDGSVFPRVKHLGLMNAEFTDDLCRALPKARILQQLETLDLSMGTMGDEGARALAADPEALRRLATIAVEDNFLGKKALAELRKIGPAIVAKGQKDADEDDPDDRYVSVAE